MSNKLERSSRRIIEPGLHKAMADEASRLRNAGWIASMGYCGSISGRVLLHLDLPEARCKIPIEELMERVPVSEEPVFRGDVLDEGCVAGIKEMNVGDAPERALDVRFAGSYIGVGGACELIHALIRLAQEPVRAVI